MKLSSPLLILLIATACAGAILMLLATRHRPTPACEARSFEGSRFTVCAFDARRDDLRLVSSARGGGYVRSFEALEHELGGAARRVRFAMNAGMFNDEGAPIGLYVAAGRQLHAIQLRDGPGNFHLKPNGVFWQGRDGAVHVETSEAYALALHEPRWATQSGPMLVIDGALHPRIADDGVSRYVRNGVGVRDSRVAYFVISSGAVSFGRLARFFRDVLHCRNALFFDGAVSSLWDPDQGRQDSGHRLGPMVVVLERR
jgi:uncharacterized protein YigE (DUF2233 family)